MDTEGVSTDFRALFDRVHARLWGFAQRRWGHVVLLLLATAAWSALWALFDIAIVLWAFPPPASLAPTVQVYWYATWGFVFPLATLFAFREHAWLPILAVLAGAWEDLLFYWFQGVFAVGGAGWTFYVRGAVFLPLAILGEVVSHRMSTRRALAAVALLILIAMLINFVSGVLLLAAIVVYLMSGELASILKDSGRTWATRPSGPR